MIDEQALATALTNKLQVTIIYQKASTGEIVTHTGGLYEIGVNKKGNPCLWLWDTSTNDAIRNFLLANIQELQVLDIPFQTNGAWPLKINGQIVGQ